jgi:uncharacterized protein involved in exopolysaccharide biosynthesis
MSNSVNLLDVLVNIVNHRKFLLKFILVVTAISIFISFLWPKSYKSTIRLLPPPAESSGLTGLLGSFFQPQISSAQIKPETILIILRSRTLKESVIKKFNFEKVYGSNILEELLKELEGHIEILEHREGGFGFNPLIAIDFSFIDRKPERAEKVTEYYVSKLDSMSKKILNERAIHTFSTIEIRYLQNLSEMNKAEEEFKSFQEKYGIFEIESQTKAVIEKLADLKTQLIKIEIQLDVLNKTISSDNTQIKQLKLEKQATQKKYDELIQISQSKQDDKVFQPLEKMPELIIAYTRLYREITVQNKIYEFIYPQYEQAKLYAEAEAQGVQIVDPARLPTYKYKPKKLYIILSGFVFSLLLGLFIIFYREMIESHRKLNSPTYKKITFIKDAIKTDLKFFWKKK